MTDYISPDDLRTYSKDTVLRDDDAYQAACTSASRAVEQACGRYFYQDSTVSARTYRPDDVWTCRTDDISTTTGLLVAVDYNYDFTYSTSYTLNTDYILHPVNPSATGTTLPWRKLQVTGRSQVFPIGRPYNPNTVRVTAKWGWSAVPEPVVQATKILGSELLKLADAPLGVAGYGAYGEIRVRENPKVRALLLPYMAAPFAIA